ncbi:MarR family winged helix-turn-helix transcriptional regulator [Desertibacillus haloalkaliphilus]|uniref:MarR family winged helix-turn-helix transcriptional regulator n=1 Tax=Desertibacillus haloalkaliphilus TaxID=1328930 RepID=UPI001C2643E9|nr:MarR family transcriptional regulator [Desertibacillus haloalkaliphilus]MBU8906194.1 MarR family transcriptional regulator [Desertibacillus haloalkaliphilus]
MNYLLKQQMLLMVRALYFCMEDHWSDIGKKFNVSPAQQHVLFLLQANKQALTPTEIGELGCWHSSTVTRLLKPLKEKGLISVEINKSRPRYKQVSITSNGLVLFDKLLNIVKEEENFPFDMSHLSEEEVLNFLEYGQRILDVHKGKDFRKVLSANVDNYGYA